MDERVDNPTRWVLATGFAAAVMVLSGVAGAEDIPRFEGEYSPDEAVEEFDEQVEQLEENYLVPAFVEDRYRLETRFNEAKVAYLLEDYDRASILFVAVIDSADPEQFDSYREALYLLGDSLFEMRNFRAARTYFRRVVDKGQGSFYESAIVKLLELAAVTDDYSEVDELYARLDDLEDVSATLHYTRGKTLYHEGRLEAARPWFQRAARDDDYQFTARYFEGVALAADGQLSEADEMFQDLTRRSAADEQTEQIIELAHLARGRLAYEQDDYEVAIDHYLQLPRTSEHFTRGLYELTWALVAQGNYESALRNLDILMISDPDPRFIPEAQSLMADMAMRIGEYDEARSWFAELVDTFVPVRRELQDFIDEHQALDEFFVDLVREELEGLQPEFLPDKVSEWVEDDPLMEHSRRLVGDGNRTQQDIDEVYEAIDEIEGAIQTGSAIEAFPVLADGWVRAMELEARMVDLEEQLLDWELRQVRPLMTSEDEERLADIEEQLEQLQRRDEDTPRTQEELEQRDQQLQEQFQQLHQELDRVALEIDGLEETLDGIAEFVRREGDQWSEEERRQVAEVRREIGEELEQLEQERRQLAGHLRQVEQAFGARDASLVEHRQLRQQIQQLQQERAEIVDARSDALDPEDARRARRVAEARRQLPQVRERLDEFFARVDALVDERMEQIETTLESERAELAAHQRDLDAWNESTEQTVAELALYNFLQVDEDFGELVRRGRVGLVDVDWQQLEDASEERRQLEDEKLETQELLREAFPAVE